LRLALALGKLPGEIDAMPYADFVELQEFYGIEPFGLAVSDTLSAHQISVMANLERDPKAKPEPYMIRDFLLFQPPVEKAPEATVEGKTAAQWRLIFAAEALQAVKQSNP
jgi:hypothetical protein